MKKSKIVLKEIELPEFGQCAEMPEIPASEYEKRFALALEAMKKDNLDFLLVFADREHNANLAFLTNLDPRFEEALLLLDAQGHRKMLLGNECMGYTGIVPIPMDYELYQPFSLMGQDRSLSRPLTTILADFGIQKTSRVGVAYYKTMNEKNRKELEIPAYLADMLRKMVGRWGTVLNANAIFMHNDTGLRHHNGLEELVRMEWASCRTSESIKNIVNHVAVGVREYELAAFYKSDGLVYTCHPMVSTGEKAKIGLSSPSARQVQLGDAFTSAFGIQGALTCRAGFVATDEGTLTEELRQIFDPFWRNYFETVVTWYENVGIGVSASDVCAQVERARDKSLFDFAVNTGHTIHLEEWVNSPFTKKSKTKLYSGMALQMDIIPLSKKGAVCANMEDGIVLADAALRTEWAEKFPASWQRIVARRQFMIQHLGIQLKDEVLPLSNIPAYYAPYFLNPKRVAVVVR
ncbi:MAG: M24 family metallopeptidase [Saprospiraceae bacterium]|nr:M24 family metallopeptidase [Saprospiraceae bacterium]